MLHTLKDLIMKRQLTHLMVAVAFSLFAFPTMASTYETVPLHVRDTIITEDDNVSMQMQLDLNIANENRDTVVEDECLCLEKRDTVIEEEVSFCLLQDDVVYTEIAISELPEKVTAAVERDFPGYTITKAAKGSDNTYRLQIVKEEEQLLVSYDENGELLKQEPIISFILS